MYIVLCLIHFTMYGTSVNIPYSTVQREVLHSFTICVHIAEIKTDLEHSDRRASSQPLYYGHFSTYFTCCMSIYR